MLLESQVYRLLNIKSKAVLFFFLSIKNFSKIQLGLFKIENLNFFKYFEYKMSNVLWKFDFVETISGLQIRFCMNNSMYVLEVFG